MSFKRQKQRNFDEKIREESRVKLWLKLFIIDIGALAFLTVLMLEDPSFFGLLPFTKIDYWFIATIIFIGMLPFIAFNIVKLVLRISKGERAITGGIDIEEMKYRFAKYILEVYNLDIFVPNHIYGDKGKKSSRYKYGIKVHRCYPAEIEKWCLEIPDTVANPTAFDGFETKILLYYDKSGHLDDDRTMNDNFGWDEELLTEPLTLYLRGPPKTEKAEKLLEKMFREKEEIPEELIERAIKEEIAGSKPVS